MLKKCTILLLTSFLVINIFAQRPEWEKMPITYLQLPSMPVSPMANKYQLNVVLDSDNNTANMYQQRQQLLQSINNTNALLAQQGRMPEPIPNDNNYYPQMRDMQTVRSAMQLNGCQQVQSSPQFIVKVNVSGFYPVNQQLKSSTVSTGNGMAYRYYFDVYFVYKISYQVFDGNGNLIRESIVYGTDKPQYKSTMAFPNQYELENWWSYQLNRNQFYVGCDNESYQQALTMANRQLNSELGFTTINEKIEVANFKDAAYADLQAAFGNASMGYNYLVSDKTKAKDYISQAIIGWEGALSESNMTEKHARINEHVTISLYINLAIAYTYAENWDKANFYIIKLKSLGKEEYKKKIEETINIEMDYEKRFKANISQ
jgi:hypothetical protein